MDFTREQMRKIVDRALAAAAPHGGECEVAMEAGLSSHTRFARNEITTSGLVDDIVVSLTVRKDGRQGTSETNDLTDDGLRAAAARAEELRALTPPDPEMVEALPPQRYPTLPDHDAAATRARAAERAPGVRAILALARRRKLIAAGFYENGATSRAIGNSKGNFGWHVASRAELSTTMRTADATGSGWASRFSPRFDDVDPKDLARRAADKGLGSARPREVPPGDYTVVLEPAAVASLFGAMQFGQWSKRAADEGRSAFSKEGGGNRIGEKMFHESVTLRTDPYDPRVSAAPWSEGGLPNRKVTWIERGVLKALSTDRYWARATGAEPTPAPGALVMEGSDASLDDLIAATDKGLLVTRFWYIRSVNPQTAQLTGLTRDGLFLIEKGKVVAPAVNLRFNESPVVMLQNVLALSKAEPAGRMVVPAIQSRAFTFTSKSDAV